MWGKGRTGRAIALAVVALGAAALMSYAVSPGVSGVRAGASVAPATATIVIEKGGVRHGFSTPKVSLAAGGTLIVVNFDSVDHTVTSVARNAEGMPVFDVRVATGTTARVPGVDLLASGSWDFFCKFHPSMRGTLEITGGDGGVEPQRPSFDQPLTVPPVLRGDRIRLTMRRARVRALPDGPRTTMWTFDGIYPGPTITRPAGRRTLVTMANRLPRGAGATSTHLHGDHHASADDGQPTTFLVRRGSEHTYDYPLTYNGKPEPGSFFWYHDHRMDRTARNNWRGLQGMFIVTEPRTSTLRLPTGSRDVPLMISERSFRTDNQLTNPFAQAPTMAGHHTAPSWLGPQAPPNDATVGDTVLVNGRAAPYLPVTATRYRLRLLNSSPFSAYNLALSDGRPFIQIGTGNGLLPRPVVRTHLLIGPAQRADVIVDFHGAAGTNVLMDSEPAPIGVTGDDARATAVMQFRVGDAAPDRSRLPATLPSPRLVPAPKRVSKTWTFGLSGNEHHGTFWSINDRAFDPERVDHRARLGTLERWRFRNVSDMTHYVHIHAEQWRTIARDGLPPPPWERGLEDTWRLEPGHVVDVAARFTDYTGAFMIHCHMLDHEDHGMMARFDVVP